MIMMKSEWYSQSIMIQDIRFIFYVFIKLKFLFKIILDFHAVKNKRVKEGVVNRWSIRIFRAVKTFCMI